MIIINGTLLVLWIDLLFSKQIMRFGSVTIIIIFYRIELRKLINFLFTFRYAQLVLPLFFAAASAGLIGTPLTTSYALGHAAYASPYAVGVAHAPLISAPIVRSYGPSVYSTPLVKHVAPVAYSAPIVKTVIPAATSYANTYRVCIYAFKYTDAIIQIH